jgi:feruloyl esterase
VFQPTIAGIMMNRARTMLVVAAAMVLLTAVGQAQGPPQLLRTPPKPLIANATPVRSCESLASVALPNTTIESATVDANNTAVCRVVAITTHPPAGDKVRIWIAIPTVNWNGRFLGTGGGGFAGGNQGSLTQPAALGFAAGATDTGHEGGNASFALDANGRLNWQAIRNFAHVGIHEMTVTGKALTEAMYGVAPRYSYFNGCSTGGRQGLMEAQRYPQDYHGIASAAPAINWTNLLMQSLWGSMLMNAASNPIAPCKLTAVTTAAVAACDGADGVTDGVIDDPNRCTYDPKALIGTSAGECGPITETDADIIRKIWQGPAREDGSWLWHGHARGADLIATSASRGTPLKPQVFGFANDWLRYYLTQNAQFDWTTVTPAGFQLLWDQSGEQYRTVIGTDNPDLTAFRDRGGKTIIWHGWADQLIPAAGSIDYYQRVQGRMGGPKKTAEFARFFLAPGVSHCAGGPGPQPTGVLDALLAWVEDGKAPETLTATRRDQAGAVTRSRPLCQYPLVAKYRGSGSTDDAANFVCK